jgi:ADP-heptose:LPS heptosyltransferase
MKILVIRRDNIGDLVCATPLFDALRSRYPDAHIAALVNSYNAGVLSGNPALDAVHAYTKLKHRPPGESWLGNLLAQFRLHAALRAQAYDYAILAKSGFDRHGLALARRVRPRHIVGFAPPGEPKAKAITLPVAPAAYDELHETEVMMKLAEPLDVHAPPGRVRVFADPGRVAQWRSRFPALERRDRRWVALHISARVPGRAWPAENFIALIRSLDCGVVLLWAPGAADNPRHPGDDEKAAAISASVSALIPAKTESLEDLVAVLSLCDGFIGVDGGAMHVAAGLGLPIVALFENIEAKQHHWRPWLVPCEMVTSRTRQITDIPVAEVAGAWTRLAARLP